MSRVTLGCRSCYRNVMPCDRCRRDLAAGETVYRLSLIAGHPWADALVLYVCGPCCDPTKETWLRGREWRQPLACRGCGRPIIYDKVRKVPRHGSCSLACRRTVYTIQPRKSRARQRPQAICQTCSQPFMPKRSDAGYCSPACRQLAYRQRQHAEAV